MSLQKIKNIIDKISDDDLEEFITDRWIENISTNRVF